MASLLGAILSLLYPPACFACGVDSAASLCGDCRAQIFPISSPKCPRCGLPFRSPAGDDHSCQVCLTHPARFDRARAWVVYEGAPLRRCLHAYKYDRQISYARPLAEIMAGTCPLDLGSYDLMLPVPLHGDRLRWRGFNQAAVLLRPLAIAAGVRFDPRILRRVRPTQPQVTLKPAQRRSNVAGAFAVDSNASVGDQRVLLFDDVLTTGATVDECAKALKRRGAAAVDVLTLARTVGV